MNLKEVLSLEKGHIILTIIIFIKQFVSIQQGTILKGSVYLFVLGVLLIGYLRSFPLRSGTLRPETAGATFLVLGDNRSGDRIYQEIVHSITSYFPSAACVIHTGDMIQTPGNRRQWKRFIEMNAPLARLIPWYGVVGNHEIHSFASQQVYQNVMDLPGNELFYSFDMLNSHFIILDTEIPGQAGTITGKQLAWLMQDLQNHAAAAHYVFVFTHRTLFPQGHYHGMNLTNADELHTLFVLYEVDAVFSGNEHQYYTFQKDSVSYVVTGGAGAPVYWGGIGESFYHFLLVELLPDRLILHVLDIYGRTIKQKIITQR